MEIIYIDPTQIRLSEDNVRKTYDPAHLEELAQSISEQGLISPLQVEQVDDGSYQVVAGHRRLLAWQLSANKDTKIPCIIQSYDSAERVIETMLVENLQRVDLSPIEEARAYQTLLQTKKKQALVAKAVGKSQAHVSKRLSLLKLPDYALEAIESGKLSLDLAHQLVGLDVVHLAAKKERILNGTLTAYDVQNAQSRQREADNRKTIEKFLKGRTDVVENIPENAGWVASVTAAGLSELMIADTFVLVDRGSAIHVYDTAKTDVDDDDDDDESPKYNSWVEYGKARDEFNEKARSFLNSLIKKPQTANQLLRPAMAALLWQDNDMDDEDYEALGLEEDCEEQDFIRVVSKSDRLVEFFLSSVVDPYSVAFAPLLADAGLVAPRREDFFKPERAEDEESEAIDPIEEDYADDFKYEMNDVESVYYDAV